jgi:hypothetical protein
MTEHTDKSPQKPGRTPPRKRPGKTPPPAGKRATAPHGSGGDGKAAAQPAKAAPPAPAGGKPEPGALAPDPATVVFGSNRPIAAPPPKLPEGSGLRFSGPSAGILKASGPQPTSPKAAGLTFTAAKSAPAKATPAVAAKPTPPRKPEPQTPEHGKAEADSAEAKKAPLTKPAIAPQASGRRFDRERSAGGFVAVMLALTVLGSGLAFWMKLSGETMAPQEAAVQEAPAPAAEASEPPVELAPLPEVSPADDPQTPGPLTGTDGLSAIELGEIQDLLSQLDFDPGSERGVLTAATAAAIRSYQEMAGLPADGEASHALLEELRSVAALYGS